MLKQERDNELALKLSDALMREKRLSANPIDVTVVNGVATLAGCVQSFRRKALAIDIADRTAGCHGVVDKLTVIPPGLLGDVEIAENVRGALAAHPDVTKEVITVLVRGGSVTLRGNVSSDWERRLARDVSLGALGVRNVRNLLLVDLAGKIEDEALTTTIQYALSRTKGLEASRVRVAVCADSAMLSGEVSAAWKRRKAEAVAARFRVNHIMNQISVRA